MNKLIKIGQLSKILNLLSSKDKKPLNYILRYWEKEFKSIKPKIINKQRYYTQEQVDLIKLIHFLLKESGMTVKGVKKFLNSKINELDDHNLDSLKADYYKKRLKEKSVKILSKINNLKKHGKKNTY